MEAHVRGRNPNEPDCCEGRASHVEDAEQHACTENGEARESLHRTNTETAELGVHVCMLTGQNEEAQLRWEELSTKLQQLQMEAQEEVETLSDSRRP